jgi:hypothetical protein
MFKFFDLVADVVGNIAAFLPVQFQGFALVILWVLFWIALVAGVVFALVSPYYMWATRKKDRFIINYKRTLR